MMRSIVRARRAAALSAAFVVPATALWPASASAQSGPVVQPVPGGAGPVAPTQPGGAYVPIMPGGGSQGGSFGYGNPQSANGTIGGGNATESSAHPVTGTEEDSFDLGSHAGGGAAAGGAVHGDENGPVFLNGGVSYAGEPPYSHIVRRGDTLWGICGYYYQNPYQWPRVWSYNPQIRNPHWIYPGDEVRLHRDGERDASGRPGASPLAGQHTGNGTTESIVDRRRQVPRGTVFLRDEGFVHDPADEIWGDVTGADADKMFLSDADKIYLHIDKGHDVHIGQELTLFRPRHSNAAGTIVQIEGTARIDSWDAQDRIARAKVVESLNVIERGAKVGPIVRSYEVVPPRRNDVDVQDAHILASLRPSEFFGQHSVVFIDKGSEAGLKEGNRLFVIRHGDAWRRSLVTPASGYRVSPDDDRPMPQMENTPGSRNDEDKYPEAVVAELRVVATKKDTATCLVMEARSEIEPYDRAVARKGY
jgi:hypothetical protein